MPTYVAKKGEIDYRWYIIDAKDKPLGRLATAVAHLLRGKGKPRFTPNIDCGDHVVIINAALVKMTGRKAEDKKAYRHSGYQSGLRTIHYGKLMATKPQEVVKLAVRGMLPKTSLGRTNFKKLHVYGGAVHPHAAQRPAAIAV